MKMNKKLITMLAALGLVGCVGVGSTLAYLTATTDPVVNTFTVGNVSIELIESQLHRSNASVHSVKSTNWQGDKNSIDKLIPADDYSKAHNWTDSYFADKTILEDSKTYMKDYFIPNSKLIPGVSIRKCPYIINTGDVAAYVRARVLVPVEFEDRNGNFSDTYTAWTHGEVLYNGVEFHGDDEAYTEFYKAQKLRKEVERDGVKYFEYSYIYVQPLEPGKMTFWNCIGGVGLKAGATAEDISYFVNDSRSFNIIVEADAIQKDGFDNAASAFKTFDETKKN